MAQDKVIGLTIRVYKGDKLLDEYSDANDSARMAKVSWKNQKPGKQER